MAEFSKLRLTNVTTGETYAYFEEQIEIEIDGEGLVSILAPEVGSREFLLCDEELASAKLEVSRDRHSF